MRYLTALAALCLAAVLTAGCCEPQYQPAYVQGAQPVYCVPQAQVQPQVVCPQGTVPVQCR